MLDAIDEALRADLLKELPDGAARVRPMRWCETHSSARSRPRGAPTSTAASRSVLAERAERAPERWLAPLAHHALAGAPGPGARAGYALDAARQAVERLAWEDAVELLARAEALARSRAATERLAEVLVALGDARLRAGETDRARIAFEEAARLARAEPRDDLFARAALGAAGLGVTIVAVDEPLVALLEEALVASNRTGRAAGATALAARDRTRLRARRGAPAGARQGGGRDGTQPRGSWRARRRAHRLACRALGAGAPERPPRRRRRARRARRALRRPRDRVARAALARRRPARARRRRFGGRRDRALRAPGRRGAAAGVLLVRARLACGARGLPGRPSRGKTARRPGARSGTRVGDDNADRVLSAITTRCRSSRRRWRSSTSPTCGPGSTRRRVGRTAPTSRSAWPSSATTTRRARCWTRRRPRASSACRATQTS